MRFMIVVKATKESEAGVKPPEEMFAAMADYHEKLAKAASAPSSTGRSPRPRS
jgi:hypothetical protein